MRHVRRSIAAILAAIVLTAPATLEAQGGEAIASPAPQTGLERWFELQAASLLARYRRVETSAGTVISNQLQDSVALKARFKFDAAGRYTINAGAATGRTFSSGWNNTGVGTGDARRDLYLKQLFATASPARGLSFSVGGLSFVRGQSTEITSYDNDGYLLGERVSVARPATLYLDEIAFTNAHLGDLASPGVTSRLRRFDEANYRQLLAGKRVRRWLALSADYTWLMGVGTARAAAAIRTPWARAVDLVQYEQYARGGPDGGFGFAASAEKSWAGKVVARAGYADVDEHYGGLNGDKFTAGRRWYAQSDVLLPRDLTVLVFVTHAFSNPFPVPNATRVDVVLSFNAMGPIRRAGLFR